MASFAGVVALLAREFWLATVALPVEAPGGGCCGRLSLLGTGLLLLRRRGECRICRGGGFCRGRRGRSCCGGRGRGRRRCGCRGRDCDSVVRCGIMVRRFGGERHAWHEKLACYERAHSDAGDFGARTAPRSVHWRASVRLSRSLFKMLFAHGGLLGQKLVSMETRCAKSFLSPRFAYANPFIYLRFLAQKTC